MKIVLDTNVLVSGLLSPYRAPAQIIRMVAANILQLCYDTRIIAEYHDVLSRPRFKFNIGKIELILEQIQKDGIFINAMPISINLSDKDDEPFLEVAIGGNAEYLITGNIKHFPKTKCANIKVVSPENYLEEYKKKM